MREKLLDIAMTVTIGVAVYHMVFLVYRIYGVLA